LRRTVVRAILVGAALSAAGGLFGFACGGVLCLANGLPWAYAGWWLLRGVFAGLAAGAIMGAVSGIYHVEDPRKPAPAARQQSVGADGASQPDRRAVPADHNGARKA
jgi:hypothetical protein